jgi:thiol-disulfide isomerase/thioredoxin
MKHIFLVAIIIGLGILTRAQTEYEISGDGAGKVLKGLISRDLLTGDTAFAWFNGNKAGYTPDQQVLSILKSKGSQVQFLVFGGTWCEDTRILLPKFFSLLDAASISDKQLTLVGVDQQKKTFNHLSEDLHITRVPTFIVMKDGKEVGRVVEYGSTGAWDKELAEIINNNF